MSVLLENLRNAVPDWVIDDENDVALFRCMEGLSKGQQVIARLWLALDGHQHLSPTALELALHLDFLAREDAFEALRQGIRRAPETTCSLEAT